MNLACLAQHEAVQASPVLNSFLPHDMYVVDPSLSFACLLLFSQGEEFPPPFQLFGCIKGDTRMTGSAPA